MKYRVLVVAEAEEDIFDIYRYVLRADGRGRADHVLRRLQETCQSPAEMPRRGHSPPELEHVGVHGYREVHFKPYRIIYQIVGQRVFIHCVLDGRRAVQDGLGASSASVVTRQMSRQSWRSLAGFLRAQE